MARARSLLLLAGVIVLGRLACNVLVSRDGTTTAAPPLQTAVLADGFAILEAVGDRHVVELDPEGVRRKRSAIPTITETRAFGTPQGAAVAYLERKKIHLALIAGDGKLGKPSQWGTSVRMMCEGLASNEHRWGVGWLEEREDRMWIVHGPTRKAKTGAALEVDGALAMPATATSWCAVRSANEYIALVYRIDTKTFVNMCSKKECSGIQTRIPMDPRHQLLDLACQTDGCVAAIRDGQGAVTLQAFNLRGKATWQKKLPYAARDSRVHLAAAGDRAYLVALMTGEGPVVERMLSKNGLIGRSWHGAQGLPVPAITWARDHALLTYWDGDALAHDVFAMPR